MVGPDGYQGTYTYSQEYGATVIAVTSPRVTICLDPRYVTQHPDQFKAVGFLFSKDYDFVEDFRDQKGQLPLGIKYNKVNRDDVLPAADEVQSKEKIIIPPEAVIATVIRRPSYLKTQVPDEFIANGRRQVISLLDE